MKILSSEGLMALIANIKNLVNSSADSTLTNSKSYTDNKVKDYIKGLSVSGKTITYTKGDGTTGTITTQDTNTTYNAAGSSFGLVKSGGDVTISDGIINVNDDSHNHIIGNVDGLQSALDGKASSSHNHDNMYYTETEIDAKFDALIGTGASTTLDTIGEISAAIEANQDILTTLNSAIGNKVNVTTFDSHTSDTTKHITSTERTNWNNAKTHASSAHAPVDAEVNQNAFSNITIGSTTISADSKTDTLTLVGSNVTLTPDATNDKVTIGITKDNVTTALGYTPPTTNTTYSAATSSALGLIKSGTDITVDSSGNVSVNDNSHKHTVSNISDLTATASELNIMDGVTATTTEINYLDGVTSSIQSQLDTITSNLNSHSSNTTSHITSTERTNWNAAYTHSTSTHAPSNAEANQNAFSNIKVGSTTVAADSKTDTLELVGSNITITPDATNDKITFTVADGTTSAKGIVQLTDSTSSTSTTTAATPNSVKSAYDLANTAKTTADSKVSSVSLASGTNNGTLKLTVNGTATDNIAVKGLGSAAYTDSSAYATSGHTHNYAGSSSAGGSANSAVKLSTARTIGISGGATGTSTSFDGSANITIPVTSIDPSYIADGYTSKGFYINTHPENSPTIIPFINNDIAYLLKRGGSAIVKYDGVVQNVDISSVFDGSPSYWAINPTNVTEVVIELTLHKVFAWTNTVYVDSGANGWRAKNVKLEVINTNHADDVWTVKIDSTNRTISQFKHTFSHKPVGAENEGGGFNKIRLTFSGWNSSNIFRIAAIGIVNYGSSGLRETFLPKDGGETYGSISPYNNEQYDLGTSNKKWKNIYANTFTGSLSGNSSTATKLANSRTIQTNLGSTSTASFDGSANVTPGVTGTLPIANGGTGATTASGALTNLGITATVSELNILDGVTATATELNYVDGVTSNIQTQLNGKANSSHGNHVPTTETADNAKFLRNDNTWQTVTPANIGAAASSHGTHVSYSTTNPVMDGTASVGTANTVSRSDHVHPTDTSRAAASHTHDVYFDTTTPRSANTVLAAPNGSEGGASFRKLVAADLPSHTHNYAGSSSAGGAATSALVADKAKNANSAVFTIPSNGTSNAEGGELEIYNQDGTYWALDTLSNNFRIFDSAGNINLTLKKGDPTNSTFSGSADKVDGFHASASVGYYLRPISYGTSALTAGSSSLTSGYVYLQYE